MKTKTFNAKVILSWFLAVVLALATLQGCAGSKPGCYSTRGMSGYK